MIDRDFFEELKNTWVDENEEEEIVNERFKKLNPVMENVYDFVLTYSYYLNSRHEYGEKYKFTMLEAHVLNMIVDNPGTTVSEIAKSFKRTNSSISQVLKRLIHWGYVERHINEDNAKFINLYGTESAKEFALEHKRYDNMDIVKTNKRLLEKFSSEELASFYNVLCEYNKIVGNYGK